MASINMKDFFSNNEEYEKWVKEMMDAIMNNTNPSTATYVPSPVMSIYGYPAYLWEEDEIIPLEQDEQGVYGYKVLVRTPNKWLLSPNYQHLDFCEWKNDQLHAHILPEENNPYGIYCTKTLRELYEWFQNYQREFYYRQSSLVVVRVQVWGTIVEHSKGLRAQHAKIERIVGYGHR